MGDPDRGFGPQQPGGWIYQATPYLEEETVFSVGKGMPIAQKAQALKQQMSAGLATFICPTRRSQTTLSALNPDGVYADGPNRPPNNAAAPDRLAKTDYAINGGGRYVPDTWPNPVPIAGPPNADDCGPRRFPDCILAPTGSTVAKVLNEIAGVRESGVKVPELAFDGVSTRFTGAKAAQIYDGLSKTALVGEKMLLPKWYETGYGDPPDWKGNDGDNSSMYQGYDKDNTRTIGDVPEQDADRLESSHASRFGSAHSSAMNMSFCDGSVHTIGYDIDEVVWGSYGRRNDGQ
jgi:prepilin-type processing-associated H-X9-DG protein